MWPFEWRKLDQWEVGGLIIERVSVLGRTSRIALADVNYRQ